MKAEPGGFYPSVETGVSWMRQRLTQGCSTLSVYDGGGGRAAADLEREQT